MHKPLLLFFTLIIILTSCKKDVENKPKVTSNQLEGNWTLRTEKIEYYDEANNKIHEETNYPNSTYEITEQSIRIYYPGFDKTSTYWISETNGLPYLIYNMMGMTRAYQITSNNNNNMTWVEERKDAIYHKDSNIDVAAKSITTAQLLEQP